jgi:glycine betaine transporter
MKPESSDKLTALFGRRLDPRVFFGACALALPFIVLGGFSPETLAKLSNAALAYLTGNWSWLYLISCSLFVLVCFLIAISPLGSIRLGRDDETPEFGFFSWFAMLFSAGMGIGLVFWSVAEPMYHFMTPPVGEPGTREAARRAFEIFFFHWGVHAWGTYVVVGLPLAYFAFRKRAPATVSVCLKPLLGDRLMEGPLGSLVNVLAIWATIMGVVTSLGLGALQINSGLSHVTGLPAGAGAAAVIIAIITCLFVLSAVTGVNRGIKLLSQLNVWLMLTLLAFFFVFGPFGFILRTFARALLDYAMHLLPMAGSLVLFDNTGWTESWTVFYWAWWVAWAPFVGAFIARISRGRTVREFILVVMIAPALFSYIFSTALGGTGMFLDMVRQLPVGEAVKESVEVALFVTLGHLPLYKATAVLTMLLIASFFITSADSATYVISRFSTGGAPLGEAGSRARLVVFWGVVLGGLAVVLIYSGGLKALQTASIVGAFPFLFVMFLLLAAVIKDMLAEKGRMRSQNAAADMADTKRLDISSRSD